MSRQMNDNKEERKEIKEKVEMNEWLNEEKGNTNREVKKRRVNEHNFKKERKLEGKRK